jgi:polar amino acid transport system substrate-binding protein
VTVKRATCALAVVVVAVVTPAWARAQDGDALSRAKAKGVLTACVDPYNFPFSANDSEPPGFDVEIARAIAQRAGLRTQLHWADTGTRGGLGRALRQSILARRCDFFMGIGVGDEEELKEKKLVLTDPYLGLGYIPLVQGSADGATKLSDLRNTKIAVPMSTPVDAYLFDNDYNRALYRWNREIMKAMAQGEIDAGMVWSPSLAVGRREHPNGKFHPIPGYTPEPALRWNLAIAVRDSEPALKQFLDESVAVLVKSGEIQKIVERYGFPYYPPFE